MAMTSINAGERVVASGRLLLVAGLLWIVPGCAGARPSGKESALRTSLPVALPDAAVGDWSFYVGQNRDPAAGEGATRTIQAVYRVTRVTGDELEISGDGGEVLGLQPEVFFEGSKREGPTSALLAGHSSSLISAAKVEDAACALGAERLRCRKVTYEYTFPGGDRSTVVALLSPRVKASGVVSIRQTFRSRQGATVESTLEVAGFGTGAKLLWGRAPEEGPVEP